MYDIIIIGAGTAGMSAAIYAQRGGKSSLMLEQLTYGGQIINTPDIENYPGLMHVSGFDFAGKLFEQAQELGASYESCTVKGIEDGGDVKVVHTDRGDYQAKAVIIATGAKNRPLAQEGTALYEKEKALTGKGVSYCATCDGMFYRNKVTAVVGGGNTALDDALFLADICQKVYVIHRRDSFRGSRTTLDKLKEKPTVEFVLNSTVTDLLTDEPGQILNGVTVTDTKTGKERKIPVSGLFVAVGQAPDNQPFRNVVDLDDKGYIIAGEDTHTGTAGVFAAGDCRTKTLRQLSTAAADGAQAATEAIYYLNT